VIAVVLIAESDPFQLRLLHEVCEAAGHEVVTAIDGTTALEVVARHRPDLAVLDVDLSMDQGERGGLDVLQILRADPRLSDVPVVVTTRAEDVEGRKAALTAGAEDYLARPYRVFEVEQRIRNALRRVLAERRLLALRDDEGLDPLTRGGSEAQLPVTLEYELVRAVRYGHPLTCLSLRVMDLDDVLEAHGRDAADATLVALAGGVRGCIRGIDHLFRGRPGELVLLLPETRREEANTVVERIAGRHARAALLGPHAAQLEIGLADRAGIVGTDGMALLAAARASRAPVAR